MIRRALILVRFAALAAALMPAGAFGATHVTSLTEATQQRFAYDGYDRLLTVHPATGGQLVRQYDGAGRVTLERAVDATHGVQSERTVSAYDTLGRPLASSPSASGAAPGPIRLDTCSVWP